MSTWITVGNGEGERQPDGGRARAGDLDARARRIMPYLVEGPRMSFLAVFTTASCVIEAADSRSLARAIRRLPGSGSKTPLRATWTADLPELPQRGSLPLKLGSKRYLGARAANPVRGWCRHSDRSPASRRSAAAALQTRSSGQRRGVPVPGIDEKSAAHAEDIRHVAEALQPLRRRLDRADRRGETSAAAPGRPRQSCRVGERSATSGEYWLGWRVSRNGNRSSQSRRWSRSRSATNIAGRSRGAWTSVLP